MLKEIESYEELLKCHLKYFTAIYDDESICGTVLVYNDRIRLRYNQHIKDGIQYDICIYNDISTECFCNLCVMIEEFTNLNNKKMDKKTFPREMYVWSNNIEDAEKQLVVYIAPIHALNKNVMVLSHNAWVCYQNAMEIEEYEAMNKNKDILDEIAETKKQINSLNDKLIKLENKLK